MSDQIKDELEAFVADGAKGIKFIELASLVEGSNFERLYRTYPDISGDAAHVTVTALDRHYIASLSDGSPMLILHPALDEAEMRMTVCELAMSMTISTLLLMRIKKKTEPWDAFSELTRRYREMIRDGHDFMSNPE